MNYYPDNNKFGSEQSIALQTSGVLKQVYFKMFLGLLVSGLVAWWCATSEAVVSFYMAHSSTAIILFIVEIGIVIAMTSAMNKMSAGMASLLFYVFAAINGATMFPIFYIYTTASIAKTFFICAGTFGAMSIYGYFTSNDLTKFGSYMVYALLGLIVVSLVNIFTKSSTLDWIISIAGVIIFLGLTAWDTQSIKRMCQSSPAEIHGHLSTFGALTLYLDFINLFLYLLRFFGSSRD